MHFRRTERFFDQVMLGGKSADRIGGGGIAGEQERLAAAAAEIDLPAVAAPAWLGHPRCFTKAPKDRRVEPDFRERRLSRAGEFQSRNLASALARKHRAVGGDRHEHATPA